MPFPKHALSRVGERYCRLDATRISEREAAALYRQLAVESIEGAIAGAVLVWERDPVSSLSLRDAATIMALAGVPEGYRLALVTRKHDAQAEAIRALEADLRRARLDAAVFSDEALATEWLHGKAQAPSPARTA